MKKRVITDVRVIADVSAGIHWYKDMEQYAKKAEKLAEEFNEFVRDHRSMDFVSLYVEREYEDQCSHCGYVWETDDEGVPVCCNAAIKEHEESLKVT